MHTYLPVQPLLLWPYFTSKHALSHPWALHKDCLMVSTVTMCVSLTSCLPRGTLRPLRTRTMRLHFLLTVPSHRVSTRHSLSQTPAQGSAPQPGFWWQLTVPGTVQASSNNTTHKHTHTQALSAVTGVCSPVVESCKGAHVKVLL